MYWSGLVEDQVISQPHSHAIVLIEDQLISQTLVFPIDCSKDFNSWSIHRSESRKFEQLLELEIEQV
jgi:hypothetical protein